MKTVHSILHLFQLGIFCLVCQSGAVQAGNIGAVGYPEFSEVVPQAPAERSPAEDLRYRKEVEQYVKRAEAYIEGCNDDLRAIAEKRQAVAGKAERLANDFNHWAKNPKP